jgi:hypothetical protein
MNDIVLDEYLGIVAWPEDVLVHDEFHTEIFDDRSCFCGAELPVHFAVESTERCDVELHAAGTSCSLTRSTLP